MALQSLLHDAHISAFLEQIPPNQRVITLKELIYIGIKVVNDQFNNKQATLKQQKHKLSENKENVIQNSRKNQQQHQSVKKNQQQKVPKSLQHNHRMNQQNILSANMKNDKIQSTLLREISKIRVQLQTLTNKVYDHYFDQQENQINEKDDVLVEKKNQQKFFNNKKGKGHQDKIISYGFGHGQDIPTFSPQRQLKASKSSHSQVIMNPFLKHKSQQKPPILVQNANYSQSNNDHIDTRTNRARSNIQHLDDTQVRQALYNINDESQSQSEQVNRTKKSQSVIQKRHLKKKKQQQNFFYQLNVQKHRLDQLKRFQQSKYAPQGSYRQFSTQNVPVRVDHIKKKAKSKIKPAVQRDRLKYLKKKQEENYKKGLEQYEFSANEEIEDDDEEQDYDDEDGQQNGGENNVERQQDNGDYDESGNRRQQSQQKAGSLRKASHRKSHRNQQFMNSPQDQFERERDISQPNFGFYGSRGDSHSVQPSYNSQNVENNRVMNQANHNNDDQSSYSEFSQFSMSSGNSRRENGKISRRRNE